MALLASLFFPACANTGVGGLAPARYLDPHTIIRPKTPDTALAAPAGFAPKPDIETPLYKALPATLFADLRELAACEKRAYTQAAFPHRPQADYVVRSAVLNVPDLVTAQVLAGPGKTSAWLVLWSRSVYGRSDLGVNRQRLRAWLASLAATVAHTK